MVLCGISTNFFVLFPRYGQVAHALLTSPPLSIAASFDLHVLSTPPAFVLSQDQTLSFNPVISLPVCTSKNQLIRNYCHNFAFLVLYRFQGSVPRSALSAVRLVYINRLQGESQRLFSTFFAFFAKFCGFRTSFLKAVQLVPALYVYF